YKGSRGLSPDSVFPPGVLTLHASVDARRRFVRGSGLTHYPESLVVPALRAFDSRLRQRFRDLIEEEGLGGFLLLVLFVLRRRRGRGRSGASAWRRTPRLRRPPHRRPIGGDGIARSGGLGPRRVPR